MTTLQQKIGFATFAGIGLYGISLTQWQVSRFFWKKGMFDMHKQQTEKEPLDPDFIFDKVQEDKSWRQNFQFRRVNCVGSLDYSKQMKLGPLPPSGMSKSHTHGAGYLILTPFTTLKGNTIFLNRGWVPFDSKIPEEPIYKQGVSFVVGQFRHEYDEDYISKAPLMIAKDSRHLSLSELEEPPQDQSTFYNIPTAVRFKYPDFKAPFVLVDVQDPENKGLMRFPKDYQLQKTIPPHHHLIYAATWVTCSALAFYFGYRRFLRRPPAVQPPPPPSQ